MKLKNAAPQELKTVSEGNSRAATAREGASKADGETPAVAAPESVLCAKATGWPWPCACGSYRPSECNKLTPQSAAPQHDSGSK